VAQPDDDQPATKGDLRELEGRLRSDLATKEDVRELEGRIDTKLGAMERRITLEIGKAVNAVAEIITPARRNPATFEGPRPSDIPPWSHRPDLNRGPTVYETVALPTELRWQAARKVPETAWDGKGFRAKSRARARARARV